MLDRERTSRIRCTCRLLITAMVMQLCGTWAFAGSGSVMTLASGRNRSGLALEIDTRWVDGNGYRPVTIRVRPTLGGLAPADRRLQVSLSFRSWRNYRKRTQVVTSIELEQGQVSAEKRIPVHSAEIWNTVDVVTTEDGRRWDDLSSEYLGLRTQAYYEWDDTTPTVLLIDEDAPAFNRTNTARSMPKGDDRKLPDFRALAGALPINYWNGNINQQTFDTSDETSDPELLTIATNLPRLEVLPARELPTNWIELTSIDLIFISLVDLQVLVQDHPEPWEAIRRWLSAGNVLSVYGAGEDFRNLAQMEKLVDLPEIDGMVEFRGWSTPKAEDYGRGAFDEAVYQNAGQRIPAVGNVEKPRLKKPPKVAPFVVRPAEEGRLVAFSSDDPFPGSRDSWNWFLRNLDANRWMWYRRHGFSLQRENEEFWNLLIPGVGESPVNSFLVLISLFVVVIGPVNYFFLQRHRRLYLLLVTVPLGALLVTGSLMLYALLTDGLGVRSRLRSITSIDQRSERVVSWSRQTYYAGLAPSGGLVFPEDTAAIPIDFRPQVSTGRTRQTAWNGSQNLLTGHFPSRTTVQYMVVDSREQDGYLKIGEATEGGPLPVENLLGVDIKRLVAHGADGRYFATSSLPTGASRELPEVKSADESLHWNSLISSNAPKYPQDFDPQQIENAALHFFGIYNSGSNNMMANPTFETSLLEKKLREFGSQNLVRLPRRCYLAETAEPFEVSEGTASRPQQSFHIVIGKW